MSSLNGLMSYISYRNRKFQYIEQIATAADHQVGGCYFRHVGGQNVVIFKSSMPVVQMRQKPNRKTRCETIKGGMQWAYRKFCQGFISRNPLSALHNV